MIVRQGGKRARPCGPRPAAGPKEGRKGEGAAWAIGPRRWAKWPREMEGERAGLAWAKAEGREEEPGLQAKRERGEVLLLFFF